MTVIANTDQQGFWSGPSGQSWIADEDRMDGLFVEVVRVLLELAGDVEGRDVLDIGCGTGAVSLAFAEAGAQLLASDISAPLLDRAATRGAGRFETLLADAQVAAWPRLFDLVVSRFGVMFFEDPSAAFANIARALKPEGRLIFAAWGPFDENVWWVKQRDIALEVLGVEADAMDPRAPGPMGLSDANWALEQMRVPGLKNVSCKVVEIKLPFHGSSEIVAKQALSIGGGARLLRRYEADTIQRARYAERIAEAFRKFEVGHETLVPALLHVFTAEAV